MLQDDRERVDSRFGNSNCIVKHEHEYEDRRDSSGTPDQDTPPAHV